MFVVLLLGSVMTGAVFYAFVLPKFQQPIEPPKPEPQKEIHLLSPDKKTSVLQITALPGTTIVRVALQTSNAHQAWGLANTGKVTDPGSLFAHYGITAQFRRLEKATDRIAALRAMASAFNEGEELSGTSSYVPDKEPGVHFFTVGGDESSRIISQTNQALQQVNPTFAAEIIGLSGLSAGEDRFLGLAEWRTRRFAVFRARTAGTARTAAIHTYTKPPNSPPIRASNLLGWRAKNRRARTRTIVADILRSQIRRKVVQHMAKTKAPPFTPDALKPYVQRAMNDPELRDDLLAAFVAARSLYGKMGKGEGVKGKAEKVTQKDFQKQLQSLVDDLSDAGTASGQEGPQGAEPRDPAHGRHARRPLQPVDGRVDARVDHGSRLG